jgi:hypothetical protein
MNYIHFFNHERIQLKTRQTPAQVRCLSTLALRRFLFLSTLEDAVHQTSLLFFFKPVYADSCSSRKRVA